MVGNVGDARCIVGVSKHEKLSYIRLTKANSLSTITINIQPKNTPFKPGVSYFNK